MNIGSALCNCHYDKMGMHLFTVAFSNEVNVSRDKLLPDQSQLSAHHVILNFPRKEKDEDVQLLSLCHDTPLVSSGMQNTHALFYAVPFPMLRTVPLPTLWTISSLARHCRPISDRYTAEGPLWCRRQPVWLESWLAEAAVLNLERPIFRPW